MKNEVQNFKKKKVNTKNVDFSYILRIAVGNENMKNLADYDVEVVASDASLAGAIDEKFAEAGASGVKTSYLEPIAPVDPKTYRPPVRKMAAHVAPAKEEAASEVVEEAPVEEAAPAEEVPVEEVAPEVVEETPVEEAEATTEVVEAPAEEAEVTTETTEEAPVEE
jgi:hypothetical protein